MVRQKLKKIRFNFPIHPFLFGVFPILFLNSHNNSELFINGTFVAIIAIVTFFTFLLFSALSLVFKDINKAGFLTSLFLLIFFSYGYTYNLIRGLHYDLEGFTVGPDKLLFSLSFTLVFIGAYFLFGTRRNLHKLTSFLNIVSISLILISSITIISQTPISSEFSPPVNKTKEEQNLTNDSTNPKKIKNLPDIYYIILDSYAREDILKDVFDFDNTNFLSYLEEKGFYVASKSNSNYAHTFLSLPSALNMEYVNYLSEELKNTPRDNTVPLLSIEDNKVAHLLKSLGYKFINIGSGWFQTDRNKFADSNLTGGHSLTIGGNVYLLNKLSLVLIQTTMLKPFLEDFIADDARAKILSAFEELSKTATISDPTYVFAHFNTPHAPYLFDENGVPVTKTELKFTGDLYKDKESYLNQLIFVNKKVEKFIDDILKNSKTPPIIIVQSDHGPPTTLGHPYKWGGPTKKNIPGIKERMAILNAYYLPDGGDESLYDSISPVNTFRLVFNTYFGASYKLFPDKSYYTNYNNFYKFYDVTDKIKIVN